MIAEFRVTPKNIQEIGRALGSLPQISFCMLFSEQHARAKLVILMFCVMSYSQVLCDVRLPGAQLLQRLAQITLVHILHGSRHRSL